MRLLMLANARVIHTRRWCDWFTSRGHEVMLATLEPSDDPCACEVSLPAGPLPGFLRYPLAVRPLNELIREFAPELINAHYLPGYGLLGAIATRGCPLALTVWGSDVLLNPGRSPLHGIRARYVLKRSALVTCDSPVLSEALVKLGAGGERVVEEPMGIDPAVFNSESRRGGQLDEPPRIISTRRHEPLYDLPVLLRALALVHERGTAFRATVAGDGGQGAKLRDQCGELGLDGFVEFPGLLNSVSLAECLSESDIYVSTSRSDSTSVSLLEAMACGAFPVVSDIPGNREWIRHGVNGLLFPVGDHGALADCLAKAIESTDLRESAAGVNRREIRSRAVWDENMGRIERAFQALV